MGSPLCGNLDSCELPEQDGRLGDNGIDDLGGC
jgi:hypothetical protein